MQLRPKIKRVHVLLASVTILLTSTIACTSAEKQAFTDAITDLVQNKQLVEQFAKEVKGEVDRSDPTYTDLMNRYEESRDMYDNFLNALEFAARGKTSHKGLEESAQESEESAASFVAAATRALAPNLNARSIPFARAVAIPNCLTRSNLKASSHIRGQMIDHYDREVRWRSWREIPPTSISAIRQ